MAQTSIASLWGKKGDISLTLFVAKRLKKNNYIIAAQPKVWSVCLQNGFETAPLEKGQIWSDMVR